MQLEIPVGRDEVHTVSFSWDQVWGGIVIAVDGAPVVRERRLVGLRLESDWSLDVGERERHRVVFRKSRPLAFAGFRPQTLTAFVDGEQVAQRTEGLESAGGRSLVSLVAVAVLVAAAVAVVGIGLIR